MKAAQKKRVLILSGISHMIEVVETAKKMGLYTIVADTTLRAPAKLYADKSYTISPNNIAQLAEMALYEKIDGVFNAFDDINAWHALALCKKLNLPIYTASEQLRGYSGIFRFKEYCRSFNVPIIEDYVLQEKEFASRHFSVRLSNRMAAKKSLQVI